MTHSGRRTRGSVRPASTHAFTLIEVVLVAAIIAILAGIAWPRFTDALCRQRVEAAARRLVIDLKYAQRLARSSSRGHRLRFALDSSKYAMERYEDESWVSVQDLDSTAAYVVDLTEPPYEAAITAINAKTETAAVFDGFGDLTTTIAITVSVGGFQKTVIADADTGEIATR